MKPTRRRGLDVAALDRLAEQQGRALGRRQQPGQHLHRRRLAAAVGAEESEDLAALDLELDVVDGGEAAEALGQPVRLDRGRSARGLERADHRLLVALARLRRQQLDERLLERRPTRSCSRISAGVPVSSTLPAFIATSQSNRSASSM